MKADCDNTQVQQKGRKRKAPNAKKQHFQKKFAFSENVENLNSNRSLKRSRKKQVANFDIVKGKGKKKVYGLVVFD